MPLKTVLIVAAMTMLLAAVGCTAQPEIREVEVTREVPVTQEVPVTVEKVQTVEVTREVPMVEEVPVTVIVPQTVEVTREVKSVETVEVTREVPVTRVVQATPSVTPAMTGPTVEPTATTPDPTVSPTDTPTATPASTVTPTVSVTPAPTNEQSSRFRSWEMQSTNYGDREIYRFRNTSIDYTFGGPAPTITYWCDTRSGRAMYINWHRPITTTASTVPSSARDPFSQYRDIPFYALVEYADDIRAFVDDLDLSDREQRAADEIWDEVKDRWFVGPGTPTELANDPMPGNLVDLLENRTHRSVGISMDFFDERIVPDQRFPHGPPSLATIAGTWIVLSDRTQINSASLGELRRTIRRAYLPQFATPGTRPMMRATVTRPDQAAVIVAKWDIAGIRQVLSHCEAIQQ